VTITIQLPDPGEIASEITPQELNRVLGMPRERELDGDLAERAAGARAWYAQHGAPYVRVYRYDVAEIGADGVTLAGGQRLTGERLAEHLRRFDAHAIAAIAVSAGVEVDEASAAAWHDDRPDEGYFLERLGVAVVERLLFRTTLEFCQRSGQAGETLTPHLSPGCGRWELVQQHALWALLFPEEERGPITLLESGGLAPKNSLLAVAGITRGAVVHSRTDGCRCCSLVRCGFRRAPYGGSL
jgi:hypothetical protein